MLSGCAPLFPSLWDSNDDLLLNIKNGIERSYLQSELKKKIKELEVANSKLEKYSHNLEELVKERTAELVETNAKLCGIFENCADGIIVTDNNGHVEKVNQAFENLIGLSIENIKKQGLDELIQTKSVNILEYLNTEDDREFYLRDCSVQF